MQPRRDVVDEMRHGRAEAGELDQPGPQKQLGQPVTYLRKVRARRVLDGVRSTVREGLAEWRYHGRLVARMLDDAHLVIRADFDYRDAVLRQFPGTFSVPTRYIKHMMVVADLDRGDTRAIEDALEAAWQLQRSAD